MSEIKETAQAAYYVAAFLVIVATIVGGWVMWKLGAYFATKKESDATRATAEAAEARADEAHRRIDLVEEKIKALPDGKDFERLRDQIADIAGTQKESRAIANSINDKIEACLHAQRLIHQWLMENRS